MPVYSHTRLKTFEECPLKYKLKYIDRVETKQENIEAFLGKRVHEVLKKLYEDLSLGRQNSVDELLAFYDSAWKLNYHPFVKVVRRDVSQRDYFDYGAQCVRNFFSKNHPFNQSQTLHLEHLVELDLNRDGRYRLQGYADRIALRSDGTFEIHDYKTGRRTLTQSEANADRQLTLYQLGFLAQQRDAGKVELIWHFLGPGVELCSRRTPAQLTQISGSTQALIADIERQTDFPAHKGPLCDWCEYRSICPAWGAPHYTNPFGAQTEKPHRARPRARHDTKYQPWRKRRARYRYLLWIILLALSVIGAALSFLTPSPKGPSSLPQSTAKPAAARPAHGTSGKSAHRAPSK